jgi:hypothetical protein
MLRDFPGPYTGLGKVYIAEFHQNGKTTCEYDKIN